MGLKGLVKKTLPIAAGIVGGPGAGAAVSKLTGEGKNKVQNLTVAQLREIIREETTAAVVDLILSIADDIRGENDGQDTAPASVEQNRPAETGGASDVDRPVDYRYFRTTHPEQRGQVSEFTRDPIGATAEWPYEWVQKRTGAQLAQGPDIWDPAEEHETYVAPPAPALPQPVTDGDASPAEPEQVEQVAALPPGKLTANFALAEFLRSNTAAQRGIDNSPHSPEVEISLRALCENVLQPISDHFRMPVRVNSGYRSPALNRAVGSKTNSQHCKGEAADIEIPGFSNYDLACFIRDELTFDQLILENYTTGDPNSGWVHVSFCRHREQRGQVMTATFENGVPKYHQGLFA